VTTTPTLLGLRRQATTGASGFALQNATPTIATYTAPNDGNIHMVAVFVTLVVTSLETGGAIQVASTGALGLTSTMFAGGAAAGTVMNTAIVPLFAVSPGATVNINQSSALTAGAATVYTEIWAT